MTSASLIVRLWARVCPPASIKVTSTRRRRVLISIYCNNLIEYAHRKFAGRNVLGGFAMKRLIILGGLCFALPFLKAQDEPAPAPPADIPAVTPTAPAATGGRGGGAN